ncbi:MAG: aminoglycoside phosphotransferase family protein [Actinobacteria bacterium]|nr:aminoglycoside phosphotransferase family protein [Actinomycetota bacterium]
MQLSHDHPLLTDEALAEWNGGVTALCAALTAGPVLRHVAGRRLTMRVDGPDGPLLLKVFARPRARGNARRLDALARSAAAPFVPRAIATDDSGHVGLIEWTPGTPLDSLDADAVIDVAPAIGRVVRILHESGAELDRDWTVGDELHQLRRRAVPATVPLVDAVESAPDILALGLEPLVSAHRDLHPRQVVVDGGRIRLIDLDDAAQAPAGLDVGNFVAHVRRDAAIGRMPHEAVEGVIEGFLDGYGHCDESVSHWERLALIRLAGLAESRHERADWARELRSLCSV